MVDEVQQEKPENAENAENVEVEKTPDLPKAGDENWTEYVMGLLSEDEVFNGLPKVDGLRRVLPKLNYHINNSAARVVQAPNQTNEYTATVEFTLSMVNRGGLGIYVTDVADAQRDELKFPYNKHVTAIAATRAEGRAIRKLLKLKVSTLEEVDINEEGVKQTKQGNHQTVVIKNICKKRKLNVDKVAKSVTNKEKLSDCTFDECLKVINELNLKEKSEFKLDSENCGV